MHMRDLYPNYFQVPVSARAKQYSIPFPIYMNKEVFQSVAKDEIFIRNHDFHQLDELVSVALLSDYFCLVISF